MNPAAQWGDELLGLLVKARGDVVFKLTRDGLGFGVYGFGGFQGLGRFEISGFRHKYNRISIVTAVSIISSTPTLAELPSTSLLLRLEELLQAVAGACTAVDGTGST